MCLFLWNGQHCPYSKSHHQSSKTLKRGSENMDEEHWFEPNYHKIQEEKYIIDKRYVSEDQADMNKMMNFTSHNYVRSLLSFLAHEYHLSMFRLISM